MSAQHTPLAHTGCEVHSEDGLLHVAHAVNEPTAARIVQCVNVYDELRWIVNGFLEWHEGNPCPDGLIERARAAVPPWAVGYPRDNARLIAAAPQLLEALRELLTDMVIAQGNMRNASRRDNSWEGCAEAIQPRMDAARAAIATATGSEA